MRAEINENNLQKLETGGLLSDEAIPGFLARRLDSGLITFALKYPSPKSGRQRWLTLGNTRDITAHEARKRAKRERARVERKNAQLKSRQTKLPWRGLPKANAWLKLRMAALNLDRLGRMAVLAA